ncbi:MAG: hypothetical protein MUE71_11695, partial [Chitinophagaceae bacterium]|nr:hypothetical protein [Chitinophagaceae bacterium]
MANKIVVTSSADSGPGTLRYSIEQANQNAPLIKDTIVFNLPHETIAQRTIIVLSALPSLTSNLVIDGSSQPGEPFGVSDARVQIIARYDAGATQKFFNITGCSNVEIYGLKLDNQIKWTAWYPDCRCISIYNSKNIQIGAPGKGNLIINWTQAIENLYSVYEKLISEDFKIYSNILGIEDDGRKPANNFHQISLNGIKNLAIGDHDPLTGNVMSAAGRRIILTNTEGKAIVANNKIGCNYFGTEDLSLPYGEGAQRHDNIAFIASPMIGQGNTKTDISVINNLSTGTCGSGIAIVGYTRPFLIQGNKIGTDITGTKRMNGEGMDYGIRIESCLQGLIGVKPGENTGANIVAFARRVTAAETWVAGSGIGLINSTKKITISKNSIFCNSLGGITIGDGTGIRPRPTINSITATGVYGTAPPLSRIELFYDDSCQNCEGKVFFDSTYADQNGNWFKENINTSGIVATATDTNGMTSEFSGAFFVQEGFQLKPETCGKSNAAIKGLRILSGTTWRWENERGEVVGRDSNLYNVPMGKYRLIVGIGNNSCEAYSDYFFIPNIEIPNEVDHQITPSKCGQPNGTLSFSFEEYNYAGVLRNAAGDSIGVGSTFDALFPGTYFYKLYAIDDESCFKEFGPFVIENSSGPMLDFGQMNIIHATCNLANGSITGIKASNLTGGGMFTWEDSLNKVVSLSLDLLNVPPGRYRLKLKDGSSCDSIMTGYFLIGNNGHIEIDTSQIIISKADCISGTGSITQIKALGAN